jgi:hypothetical protein
MYLVGGNSIAQELEPLMSLLAVPGRWMSAYGASECAVMARKKQKAPRQTWSDVTGRHKSLETEPGHPLWEAGDSLAVNLCCAAYNLINFLSC